MKLIPKICVDFFAPDCQGKTGVILRGSRNTSEKVSVFKGIRGIFSMAIYTPLFHTVLFMLLWLCFPVTAVSLENERIDSLETLLESSTGGEKAGILLELSRSYWFISFERSLEYAAEAYGIAEATGSVTGMADALNRSGNVHYFLNNHERALEYYNDAYEIIQEEGDYLREGIILNNIGLLYMQQQMFGEALDFLARALDAKIMTDDRQLISSTLAHLGRLKTDLGDYDGALEYYNDLLSILEELPMDGEKGSTYSGIAKAYYLKGEYNESLENYYRAIDIFKGLQDSVSLARVYNSIGKVYLDWGNLPEAYRYISMSGGIASELELVEIRSDNHRCLSEYFEAAGDARAAHEHFVIHINLKDSIFKADSEANLENLKNIFETESREKQIELLQKEYEVHEMELRKQRAWSWFIISSLIIVTVIMVVFIWRFRLRNRTNLILKDKKIELEEMNEKLIASGSSLRELNATKDRFFSIIANDLKNPFTHLLGTSEKIARDIGELPREEIKEQVGFINRSSKNLFRLLENLLQWSATQTRTLSCTPERFDLSRLVRIETDAVKKIAYHKNISLMVDEPGNGEIAVYADKNLISSTISNLVENALKYTPEDGQVTVSVCKKDGFAEVCVKDNGLGIEQERLENIFQIEGNQMYSGVEREKGSGLGLILCREFVEINGGEIRVESQPGMGSCFIFTVPLSK